MEITQAANAFKELGHPTRLSIFTLLVKAGHGGLPVGRLQESLQVPNSTLFVTAAIADNITQGSKTVAFFHCGTFV